jgi:hypothetical protein
MCNHSCDSNGTWVVIGDVLVMRAAKPIAAGEEVWMTYHSEGNALARQLLDSSMKCACPRCIARPGDKNNARRAAILKELSDATIPRRRELVAEMEKLDPAPIILVTALQDLSIALTKADDYAGALAVSTRMVDVLRTSGVDPIHHCQQLHAMFDMITHGERSPEKGQPYLREGFAVTQAIYGVSLKLAAEMWGCAQFEDSRGNPDRFKDGDV